MSSEGDDAGRGAGDHPLDPGWMLVDAAVGGDREAVDRLVDLHGRFLRYLLLRRAPRLAPEIDDLVDETWYRVLRRLRDDPPPRTRPFVSWLGGVALNVLRARLHRPPSSPLVDDPEAPDPDGLAAVLEAELLGALHDCLADLPGDLAQVHRLLYREERPLVAAAGALGCSDSYVARLRRRLHEAMVRCLARKGFRADNVS